MLGKLEQQFWGMSLGSKSVDTQLVPTKRIYTSLASQVELWTVNPEITAGIPLTVFLMLDIVTEGHVCVTFDPSEEAVKY